MAQFDVFRNPNPATRTRTPFLLDVQAPILEPLATRIVVPLCKPDAVGGKPAEKLNPQFEFDGRKLVMVTQELAGIPRKALGEYAGSLADERGEIIAALDFAFTGI
jgi:toxin CcdB